MHIGRIRKQGRYMKQFLLAGASLIALTSAAVAGPTTTFNYAGSFATYTVADTGTYQITAFGAEGGFDNAGNGAPISVGARIGGTFSLTSGDVLRIAVGGAGGAGAWAGGGGGGTFIYDQTTGQALVIAGGGGGGWFTGHSGGNGLTTTGGSGGGGSVPVSGNGGGGGGGLTGNGASTTQAGGGGSFASSLLGGFGTNGGAGGFGGGGGGGPNSSGSGGGGGGGYTGGSGGYSGGGGGGGSFNNGTSPIAGLAGANYGGNGLATITETASVPEPVSGALLGVGAAGLGFVRRRSARQTG